MKQFLLFIPLLTLVSCVVPTVPGLDFVTGANRIGIDAVMVNSSSNTDSDFAVGDNFGFELGYFLGDALEIGIDTDFSSQSAIGVAGDSTIVGAHVRYYLQTEGNLRPWILGGMGTVSDTVSDGTVFRAALGVSQFFTEEVSFDVQVEQQYFTLDNSDEVDVVNVSGGLSLTL